MNKIALQGVGRSVLLIGLSVLAAVMFVASAAWASTTISTNVQTDGTLSASGAASLGSTLGVTSLATLTGGFISVASSTLVSTTNLTGAVTMGGGATVTGSVVVSGTASSTTLLVGSDRVTAINGLIQGTCSFSITSGFTASTTQYADCTAQTGTGLYSGYKVFVQATSSMPSPWVIQAASSTNAAGATGVINLRVLNTGLDGTAVAGVAPAIFLNFWAVR